MISIEVEVVILVNYDQILLELNSRFVVLVCSVSYYFISSSRSSMMELIQRILKEMKLLELIQLFVVN